MLPSARCPCPRLRKRISRSSRPKDIRGPAMRFWKLAKELGLDALFTLAKTLGPFLAMIVGRIVSLDQIGALQHGRNTALWDLSRRGRQVDVDRHCYLPMTRLLERQTPIQRFGARLSRMGHGALRHYHSATLKEPTPRATRHLRLQSRWQAGSRTDGVALLCSAEGLSRRESKFLPVTLRPPSTVPE